MSLHKTRPSFSPVVTNIPTSSLPVLPLLLNFYAKLSSFLFTHTYSPLSLAYLWTDFLYFS